MDLLLQLVLPLALVLAAMQLPLLGLARLLGRRLTRVEIVLGLLLPWLLLAPAISTTRILAPCNLLANVTPGIDGEAFPPERHGDLNDAIFQFLPWEVEVRRALRAGRLPFWSDLLEGGSSPWSNPQAQTLSPVALATRVLPLRHFFLAGLALKILIAFQGASLLARRLGAPGGAALLAGGCFALGGGILAWGLFPHSSTAAWAPWVVAGVVAVVRSRYRAAAPMIGLALVTAALMVSGHPETAAGAVLLAALCGVGLRRRRDPFPRAVLPAALAGLLGIGLTAPLLLPFSTAMGQSLRAAERAAEGPRSEPAPPGGFHLLGYRIFPAALNGYAVGEPYGGRFRGTQAWALSLSAYTGFVALVGGAAALATRARRRASPLLVFWLVSLVLSSRYAPLEELLFTIPALRFPEMSRLLPVGSLALAVAGAVGFGALARRFHWTAWTAGALALLLAAWSGPVMPLVAVAALALAGCMLLARRRQRPGFAALLLALLVELVPWGRAQLPACAPALFFPPTAALWVIQQELAGGPWRVVGEDYAVYPSVLPVYGLAELRPHNPLAPMRQLETLTAGFGFSPDSEAYFSPFGNVEHPLLDFLNVRVVVSSWAMPAKERLEGVLYEHPLLLFRNPQALPRWFLPTAVERVAPLELPDWLRRLEDGRRVALEGEALHEPLPRWSSSAVEAFSERPGRARLEVAGAGSQRLVASSVPGPLGWTARTADGELLDTVRINGAFLGVSVPPVVEVVELSYRPPGLGAGALVAAAATVALALLSWVALGDPKGRALQLGSAPSLSGRRQQRAVKQSDDHSSPTVSSSSSSSQSEG